MRRPIPLPALARGFAIAGLSLALLVPGAAWLLDREREALLAHDGERLSAVAGAMTARLEGGLHRWLADAATLATTPALAAAAHDGSVPPGRDREVLDALQRRSPEYAWIGIVRPSGVVATGSGGLLEGVDISHRPIFRGGVGGPFLGDIHAAVLLERLLRERRPDLGTAPLQFVDAAVPIRASGGGPDGVAAIHVDWSWAAAERAAALAALEGAPAPELLLLDVAGRVILGEGTMPEERVEPEVLSGAGPTVGRIWISAHARTGSVAGHPGLGWSVVARREVADVLEPLGDLRLRLGVLSLLAALAAGAVGAVGWRPAPPAGRRTGDAASELAA